MYYIINCRELQQKNIGLSVRQTIMLDKTEMSMLLNEAAEGIKAI